MPSLEAKAFPSSSPSFQVDVWRDILFLLFVVLWGKFWGSRLVSFSLNCWCCCLVSFLFFLLSLFIKSKCRMNWLTTTCRATVKYSKYHHFFFSTITQKREREKKQRWKREAEQLVFPLFPTQTHKKMLFFPSSVQFFSSKLFLFKFSTHATDNKRKEGKGEEKQN